MKYFKHTGKKIDTNPCPDVMKQHSEESQQDSSPSREMVSGEEGDGLGL